MPEEFDNGSVRYSVKELLGRIDKKLDDLSDLMATKASAEYVLQLEARVDLLERTSANAAAVRTFRNWLIGLSLTVGGLMLGAAGLLVSNYPH